MKILATKVLALGSLCALLMGTGSLANAQGYERNHDHQWQHGRHMPPPFAIQHDTIYWHAGQSERRRLDQLHAVYAHDVARGNYGGAERAHEHAEAIRAQLRARGWHRH